MSLFLPQKSAIKLYHFKIIFALLFIFITIFSALSCAPSSRFSEKRDKIKYNPKIQSLRISKNLRVLLSEEINSFKYKVDEPVDLLANDKKVAHIKKGNVLNLRKVGSQLSCTIGTKNFTGISFKIKLSDNGFLPFNNKKYRGEFEFITSENSILLINQIDIEDYLLGVLPYELPTKNNRNYFEALKAFAITARTFALSKMLKNNSFFDIYPDVRDQVYGGADRETQMDLDAINETRDLALYYNNELAEILYHASCGGTTEAVKNIFSKDLPYLASLKDGDENEPNCSISPNFAWKETYTGEEISNMFFNTKFFMEPKIVTDIEVLSRFPSGRVSKIKVSFQTSEEVIIDHKEIRSVFKRKDNGILRSLLFDIQKDFSNDRLSKLIISGRGTGHGVGLCQWGSLNLSQKGYNFKQIIEFYYPSLKIQEYND